MGLITDGLSARDVADLRKKAADQVWMEMRVEAILGDVASIAAQGITEDSFKKFAANAYQKAKEEKDRRDQARFEQLKAKLVEERQVSETPTTGEER